jgi:phage terminase large subunit GpA-like protein
MGARYLHFPASYSKEYFDGLTAEEKRVRYSHGFPETYYEKIRARNEPLDLRVYQLAAMEILKPNIAAIRENLKRETKPSKEYILRDDPKPIPKAPTPQRRRIGMAMGFSGKKWM